MKKKKSKSKPKSKAKPKAKAKVAIGQKIRKAVKKSKPKAKKVSKKSVASKKKAVVTETHPKPTVIAPINGQLLGYVEDYFAKIGVVALTLQKKVAVGDRLHVLGYTTNFEQPVGSMEVDHQSVSEAQPKEGVGIKVTARARRGDHVYLIVKP